MKRLSLILANAAALFVLSSHVFAWETLSTARSAADTVILTGSGKDAVIAVDPQDYPVVKLAANFFAEDVKRVTGRALTVTDKTAGAKQMVLVGTLGHSALIDKLVTDKKIEDIDKIKGRWEATLTQMVNSPFPGVDRAFVIVGSDRRGAAYGLMQLSEKIGVSPWYWWADVPAAHREALSIKATKPEVDMPAVKFRGIFINDEDWGLYEWASKTFEADLKNIGPKTYEKIFEFMLRLRLNYIWPAMHECSKEFELIPENAVLADKYGIIAGSSHCEPMLCNNAKWQEKVKGPWNYSTNRDTIHSYWEGTVKARGDKEAVWTMGIRGIHDKGMQKPPDAVPDRIKLVEQVFSEQRDLLGQYVTKEWGAAAQCFVPYKEVLPLYDAGLKVPDDVTIVWVDDNFSYIRRLGAPAERKRAGGAGVYWHMSYYGGPHSYLWINTTAPALMWEELHKAWENDARTLWVINVGDGKPTEIGMDYFSRFAWNPEGTGPDSQPLFLKSFAARTFGEKNAQPIADMLGEFYRLGTVRKPELMIRSWAVALPQERADELTKNYKSLLASEAKIAASIPAESRDGYTELIGFPTRVLAATGLIFMADRQIQFGENVAANEAEITRLRAYLDAEVENINTKVAGGKWNRMYPGAMSNPKIMEWNSQVRWPWGEKPKEEGAAPLTKKNEPVRVWRDAASADRQIAKGKTRWTSVTGLGATGKAMTLKPAGVDSSWKEDDKTAPTLEYKFTAKAAGDAEMLLDFMPTFRIYPGMKLRVAVSVDDQAATVVEVPGSSGTEDENGRTRNEGVQNNYVRAQVPLKNLVAGKHTVSIRAVDPGVILDRVSLP